MSPTHRVDFETQGGSALCGEHEIKIARTIPPNLEQHQNYSQSSWDDFCNQIDSVLESLSALRKRNARLSCYVLGVTLVLLVIIPLFTKVWLGQVFGDFWFVAFFIGLCIPMFGICYLTTSAKTKDLEIIGDLHYICKEATERTPGFRFMLKRERVYQGSKSVAVIKFILVQDVNAAGRRARRPGTPDTIGSNDDVRTQSSGGGSILVHAGQVGPQNDAGPHLFDRLRSSISRVDAGDRV
jgi:hypothetical protein